MNEIKPVLSITPYFCDGACSHLVANVKDERYPHRCSLFTAGLYERTEWNRILVARCDKCAAEYDGWEKASVSKKVD